MFSDFLFTSWECLKKVGEKTCSPATPDARNTLSSADRCAIRMPTLRNAELTAPYMHDGAFATLKEVVRFYDQGAIPRHPAVPDALVDPFVRDPIGLTNQEVSAIVEFLRALTDPGSALDPALLTVPAWVPSALEPVFGVRAP